jgi:predicted molibdopterin-dependent oxidoreductase YjgC
MSFGLPPLSDKPRARFENDWGVPLLAEPGLRIPNMMEVRSTAVSRAVAGEELPSQSQYSM